MKFLKLLALFFSASFLFPISPSLGLVQQSNNLIGMGWQTLPSHLPANTLAIAASTEAQHSDFVAIASDADKIFYFYLLDHEHLSLGWQKTQPFLGADVTSLQYGLNHFIATGTDRTSGNPVMATSEDYGRTWSQSLLFAGKGHYDSAAFSEKLGMMTGKDGAIAISTDGTNWVETVPPSGIPRKVIYSNTAPAGAPVDKQFQLYPVLPSMQSALYGFLQFHDIPISGTLLSSDGKNWSYAIPYSIIKNQLLLYQNKTFLVNDTLTETTYAYHDSTNLGESNFTGLALTDPTLPIINVFQFTSYQQNFVVVGYDGKTGAPLSLFSDSKILNNNIIFVADFFPKVVRLIAANQCGFLAVADDGTCYYSTPSASTL